MLQDCFCFMFWLFGPEACVVSSPRPGIEPTLPAVESEVLTPGSSGKSQKVFKNMKQERYMQKLGGKNESRIIE